MTVRSESVDAGTGVAEHGAVSARIVLCEHRFFNFGNVAAMESLIAVIAPAVPCWGFASGTLIVRVHDIDVGAQAQIEVCVSHASPSSDDPLTEFVLPSPAARAVFTSADAAGTLRVEHVEGMLGTHFQVAVQGAQPRTAVAASVTMSIELLLRNVVRPMASLPTGTSDDAILRYDSHSNAWVENSRISASPQGDVELNDLSVGGSAVVDGNLSVDGNAVVGGTATVEGQVTSSGDLTLNPTADLLVSATKARLSVSSDTANGGVRIHSGANPGTDLRVFTFSGTVSVGASSTSNQVFVNGADRITPQNSGAFVTVQMVARWGTSISNRAGIRIHRFYNRLTGNAVFSNLLVDALSQVSTIVLSALTTSNQVGVAITNSGSSALWVDYAATVTLQSTPVLPT